ncbi:LOW QUALITY PROTEIN: hypothetical protein Cgig2_014336 [Carnegiea gigantea]|uniref:Uncharacterized protein n=1 Tax=Carnegiea gigantea TaxID=171969 RepID=A0A9Q1JHB6_9CARY|nr:LOW QUALITY PROTEIN: hypothetical protein Cgig2_014336 [Carnegiea gigantea]
MVSTKEPAKRNLERKQEERGPARVRVEEWLTMKPFVRFIPKRNCRSETGAAMKLEHSIVNSLRKQRSKGLFKMVTFMDKTTSGRCNRHIQPRENDVDREETKLPIRNPITSLCKSDRRSSEPSLVVQGEIEDKRNEWLEDILVRCKDKLTTFPLFDASYVSLFLYDRCSNLIWAVCEYWCPEMNTLHPSKGEVSLAIFDIYSFLGLPFSRHLYDEVVPTQRELTSKLLLSCTYLFIAYHKLMQGRKGKPTIEQ